MHHHCMDFRLNAMNDWMSGAPFCQWRMRLKTRMIEDLEKSMQQRMQTKDSGLTVAGIAGSVERGVEVVFSA